MAGADRLVRPLDRRARFAAKRVAVERRLELVLEVILAAFDLVDDALLVAPGDRRLEVEEALVGLAHERAVVLGIAAEPADFGAKLLDDPLPLAGALSEQLLEAARLAVRGRVFIAGD